ncbi:MAG: nicotinate-nucleotide adenylyltransferase [Christensenellaceae bacterium]|jgi:nicotinate-nucleotide adenylyltransferase|nr:nicotinate-nucleotide adenylyltransferase [Christensenellaceae bacterium]
MEMIKFEKQLGIMGGTFDPIHNGHIQMAQKCMEKFALDEVIFLPAGEPPHKRNYAVTDKYKRLEMTRLAVKEIPGFSVSDIEIERSGYTYTIDSLRELGQIYKNARFFYIIGADTLGELYTWRNIEEVARLTKFLVVGRSNIPSEALHNAAARVREDFGGQLLDAQFNGPELSSTFIRDLARKGAPLEGYVPLNVARYIKENNIYGA